MSNLTPDVIPENATVIRPDPGERVMDRAAVDRLVDWAVGKGSTEHTKETLRQELSALAAELAGPDPAPIERVLSQVAGVNWMMLRTLESYYLGALGSGSGMTFGQVMHQEKRLDRTQRRFLSTIRTLAAVRKLAIPAVQVNIANVNGAAKQPAGSKQLNGSSVFGDFDKGVYAGIFGDGPEGRSQ